MKYPPGCGPGCPCRVPRQFGVPRTVFSTGETVNPSADLERSAMRWPIGVVVAALAAYGLVTMAERLGVELYRPTKYGRP